MSCSRDTAVVRFRFEERYRVSVMTSSTSAERAARCSGGCSRPRRADPRGRLERCQHTHARRAGRRCPRAAPLSLRVRAGAAGRSGDRLRGAVDELGAILDGASTAEQIVESMLESLDHYSGDDPTSLLFAETFLAATRDDRLRVAVGRIVEELRQLHPGQLAPAVVAAPEETSAVLAAAVDGLVLHRALSPGLTASSAAVILRRLLLPSPEHTASGRSGRAPAGS